MALKYFLWAAWWLSSGVSCAPRSAGFRPFPGTPVIWQEDDRGHVAEVPVRRQLEAQDLGLFVRDFGSRELQRFLSLEQMKPAEDVNARDEVPCSTWFCARHHLAPMTTEALLAGPPGARPPVLPLAVTKSKDRGAAAGFSATDAQGHRFLIKLDPPHHAGLSSGAEIMGNLIFYGAGYNVAGAFSLHVPPDAFQLAEQATFQLSGVAERPFTRARLDALLANAGHTREDEVSAAAIPWIEGEVLGAFDMMGTRSDDPNDRIPHQHRRSLRASRLLFGWLNVHDASALNTLDSYVEEDGRRFVRHHFIDFGAGLGSASWRRKDVFEGRESLFPLSRLLASLLTLGIYQRDWQRDQAAHDRSFGQLPPALGWFHPTHGWDPRAFHTNRKVPAHLRMTPRDGYWGAKVITSFTRAQLRSLVNFAYAGRGEADAVFEALVWRQRRIGETYLREYAAVEAPRVEGSRLCYLDIAVARGFYPAAPRHVFELHDGRGRLVARADMVTSQARLCVPLPETGPARQAPYLVMAIRTQEATHTSRPSYVHLQRGVGGRLHVVGLERID